MRLTAKLKKILLLLTPPILINSNNNRKSRAARYSRENARAIEKFACNFEVIEFSYIDVNSPFDLKWGWWSRVYEYELTISTLKKLGVRKDSTIHNTCWGYHGSHILFKKELESLSQQVTNSDRLVSEIENTSTHDLRGKVPENWIDKYDFVINISTIEEIAFSHVKIVENLLAMTKINGYLIATFDLPGMQLEQIEKLFKRKIQIVENPLRGDNSPYQMNEYSGLKVGYFVIRKLTNN
jgi:hypothetical protein